MVVRIDHKRMYLWRAVDHEGEILDISAHYDSLIAVPATISKVPTRAHPPAFRRGRGLSAGANQIRNLGLAV
jgi:hypothetical protein